MNPYTGEVRNVTTLEEEKQAIADGFTVGVKRDLNLVERANRQIMLYQPCGCSGGHTKYRLLPHSRGGKLLG